MCFNPNYNLFLSQKDDDLLPLTKNVCFNSNHDLLLAYFSSFSSPKLNQTENNKSLLVLNWSHGGLTSVSWVKSSVGKLSVCHPNELGCLECYAGRVLPRKPPFGLVISYYGKHAPTRAVSRCRWLKTNCIILCLSSSLTDPNVTSRILGLGDHCSSRESYGGGGVMSPRGASDTFLDRNKNLQQSQMTYDCTLNARKCHRLHSHTQHKSDRLY